jgi:outer membrane protein TolC
LRANVDIEKSDARTQYLAWKEAMLNGVEEVENALSAVRHDTQTLAPLRRQVQTAEESLALSTTSYNDGASSLLDVLDAQRSVSDAQASLAATVQEVAKDYVDLYVAIGAGYLTEQGQNAPERMAKSD